MSADGFVKFPNAWQRAWESGELSCSQVLLLVRLKYRCWRDHNETHFTLRALTDEIDWEWSQERLRLDLYAMAEMGRIVITRTPEPGSRTQQWSVRLMEADL